MTLPPPLIINGWTFLAWPAFDARWVALLRAVIAQRASDATSESSLALSSAEARMLSAIVRVVRDQIARDPNAPEYRLQQPLGAWRRVKFLGRFRLFYRFSSTHRLVVLAWLNDQHTLRKDGARTDPYTVFSGMLHRGEIPEDWDALVAEATRLSAPPPHHAGEER